MSVNTQNTHQGGRLLKLDYTFILTKKYDGIRFSASVEFLFPLKVLVNSRIFGLSLKIFNVSKYIVQGEH